MTGIPDGVRDAELLDLRSVSAVRRGPSCHQGRRVTGVIRPSPGSDSPLPQVSAPWCLGVPRLPPPRLRACERPVPGVPGPMLSRACAIELSPRHRGSRGSHALAARTGGAMRSPGRGGAALLQSPESCSGAARFAAGGVPSSGFSLVTRACGASRDAGTFPCVRGGEGSRDPGAEGSSVSGTFTYPPTSARSDAGRSVAASSRIGSCT